METIAYTCKLCNHPGQALYDPDAASLIDIGFWSKALIHNRCAEFLISKRSICYRVDKVCRSLFVARHSGDKQLREIESMAREKLDHLTRRLANICCDYLRLTNVWDQDFVEMLFERPDVSSRITADYFHRLQRLSKQRAR